MLGMDHLIARSGIALAQKSNDLVAADAADDARRIEPVDLADGGAQRGVICRGVAVQFVGGLAKRLLGGLGGAERVLVGAELDHIGHALHMPGPALIERYIHDARLWRDLGHVIPRVSQVVLALTSR